MVKEVQYSLVFSPALLEEYISGVLPARVDSLHRGHTDPNKGNRGQGLTLANQGDKENIASPFLTGLVTQPSSSVREKLGWALPGGIGFIPSCWHLIWMMCVQLRKHTGSIHVKPFRHNQIPMLLRSAPTRLLLSLFPNGSSGWAGWNCSLGAWHHTVSTVSSPGPAGVTVVLGTAWEDSR